MSGIFALKPPAGRPRCARCRKPFTPKGDEIWGPTCARKMHAQLTIDKIDEGLTPEQLEDEGLASPVIEVKDEKGEVTAVII